MLGQLIYNWSKVPFEGWLNARFQYMSSGAQEPVVAKMAISNIQPQTTAQTIEMLLVAVDCILTGLATQT